MVRRIVLLALTTGLFGSPLSAQTHAEQALTNQSVIDMVVGKLPKDLIIEKIRTSAAAFDVSTSALVALNQAKVPKDIIKLMMMSPRGGAGDTPLPRRDASGTVKEQDSREPEPSAADRSDRLEPVNARPPVRRAKPPLSPIPSEAGIHLRADGVPLTFLEPTNYTGGRTSGTLGSALTGGIAKAKMKATVSGADASIRFRDPYPEFYFIFEQRGASLSNSNQWWSQLTSPNQFTLVRLDKKPNRREVTTASVGAFSAQSGTDEKAIVGFTLTRLKPGVYQITPREALAPGEYAFFPASMGGQGTAGANLLFDFGVDGP